jgi:nicotinate-nucleotide adenylyltransferase
VRTQPTNDTKRPIAIFGGTFDPVHNGHLRVAWEAAEALDATVYFLPANEPPHRSPPLASAAHRVEMLRLALAGQDRLAIDLRELRREGPSYTLDTLREMRAEIGSERSLILLVGADAFAGLPTWNRWQEIFDLAHIGVLARPGASISRSPELEQVLVERLVADAATFLKFPSGKVVKIGVSALEISATAIRAELARGGQPRYLLPDALLDDPDLLACYRSNAGDLHDRRNGDR